jgi:1-acyl-sn-glycerol-3-phosphate acyltransferase
MWGPPVGCRPGDVDVIEFVDNFTYRGILGGLLLGSPGVPIYAVVRVIARFWIWFFFDRVEVRHPDRVPSMGPVLLCINHPNNLIDSLLVGSVLPRKVHYLATSALFRNRFIARLLVALGVIPVSLKANHPGKVDRNTEMFVACEEAFDEERQAALVVASSRA